MKKLIRLIILLPFYAISSCPKMNIENNQLTKTINYPEKKEIISGDNFNNKNLPAKPEINNTEAEPVSVINKVEEAQIIETPHRIKPSYTPTPTETIIPSETPSPSAIKIASATPKPIIFIPEMVLVQGGVFQMGNEKAQEQNQKFAHKVKLNSFYIGKYELTQKEYQSLIGNNLSIFKGENRPVEMVTWFDAIKYCNYLSKTQQIEIAYDETTGNLLDDSGNITTDITRVKGYRLPTEAEWEFAARGGNKSKKTIYSGSNLIDSVSWYRDNSGHTTHDVGTKSANELGLYDMSGNIWEWTTDLYLNYISIKQEINPYISSSDLMRVGRGGCWGYFDGYSSVSYRGFGNPLGGSASIGFRIARTYN